jgi:hypothetical protein
LERSILDWGGNLGAFAVMILLNVLSNAVPLNGQTMTAISAKYSSLFTPAGFTFSIWGVIYLALLAFVVWQALPAQRRSSKIASISIYFKINCLANALWIVVWHYDLLALSLVVMLIILSTLVLIYRALMTDIDTSTFIEHLVLYLPFSLYAGWITVATVANASVLQTGNGWDDLLLTSVQWTLAKLALAGAIGTTVIVKYRDPVFAIAVAWAAFGIAAMQSATPAVAGAATTLSLLLLFLVVKEGASRLTRN